MLMPFVLGLLMPVQAVAPPPADAASVKPICRREIPLGSTIPKRTCHAKAEWAAIDRANAGAADTMLRNPRQTGPGTR